MRISWLWRIVAHARHQRRKAEEEVVMSQRSLDKTERRVTGPAARMNERNHYSDIIRDALQLGYGPPTPVHGTRRPE